MKTPITIKKFTRSGARREIHNPGDTKEEIMTHSQRPRCLLGFRKSLAPVTSAMIAVLIGSGLVAPVGGEDKVWCGGGWTGQPLVWERPDGVTEVIFGAYDKHIHFVDAATGEGRLAGVTAQVDGLLDQPDVGAPGTLAEQDQHGRPPCR